MTHSLASKTRTDELISTKLWTKKKIQNIRAVQVRGLSQAHPRSTKPGHATWAKLTWVAVTYADESFQSSRHHIRKLRTNCPLKARAIERNSIHWGGARGRVRLISWRTRDQSSKGADLFGRTMPNRMNRIQKSLLILFFFLRKNSLKRSTRDLWGIERNPRGSTLRPNLTLTT